MEAETLARLVRELQEMLDGGKGADGTYTANPVANEYYALARAALEQAARFAVLAHYAEIHGPRR